MNEPLTEDDKLLAASQAAGNERANRPTVLLLLAGFVLAAALLFALVSYSQYAAAKRVLARQSYEATTIAQNVAAVRALRANSAADTGRGLSEQDETIRSRLIDIAVGAGINRAGINPPTLTRVRKPNLGSVQMNVTFDVRDPNLQALMTWLDRATEQMAGIEVQKIKLEPKEQDWRLLVTFTRWEKAEEK
jgi:hypothetical protein